MKIAIAAAGPTMDAKVERRLGLCAYLLIVDSGSLLKAIRVPDTGGHGSGLQVVALALAEDARAILVGYVSPDIARTLRREGVDVVTSCVGSARDAAERYARGDASAGKAEDGGGTTVAALRKSAAQLASMLPVLLGVVLLIGLLKTSVSGETLASMFSGEPLSDAFRGASVGSIFAGNPVNSYVIAEASLRAGVSLFAVTAFMLTWVTVGLVQLPAEITAFGARFAITRTVASFMLSVPTALVTVAVVSALT